MPDPVGTLTILIEAGVAIAGFSGVVVVFGRRGEREWSRLERGRLEILLTSSLAVLFLSFAALLLLHAGQSPATTWRVCSAAWAAVGTFEVVLTARRAIRAHRVDPEVPHVAWVMALLGISVLLVFLSVANVLVLEAFWPFMAGLVWLFAIACYSFVRLLFVVSRSGQAA